MVIKDYLLLPSLDNNYNICEFKGKTYMEWINGRTFE